MPVKPSRTFTLSVLAVLLLAVCAIAVLVLCACHPDRIPELSPVLSTVALGIAGAGGLGAGAMGLRDFGSGGLTSSQGMTVAAAQVRAALAAAAPAAPAGPTGTGDP